MTNIITGQIYKCISQSVIGFQIWDKAEALSVNPIFDMIEVKRLACLSNITLPLSTFENNFAMFNNIQTDSPSFDDLLGKGLSGYKCHCGIEILYRNDKTISTVELHSDYCPKYYKRT